MKIQILSIATSILLCAFTVPVGNKHSKESVIISKAGTQIKWTSREIDLGSIPQNKPADINFEFTNTGESPVLISDVKASCGCTGTSFVKTPIMPGEKSTIKATYNAASLGVFRKTITVITNADAEPVTLVFTGTVI